MSFYGDALSYKMNDMTIRSSEYIQRRDTMKSVTEEAFRPYGRVLPLETKEFCEALKKIDIPAEGT